MLSNQKVGIFGALSNQVVPAAGNFTTDVIVDNANSAIALLSTDLNPIQLAVQALDVTADPYYDDVVLSIANSANDVSKYHASKTVYGSVYFQMNYDFNQYVFNMNWADAVLTWPVSSDRDIPQGQDFTAEVHAYKLTAGTGVGVVMSYVLPNGTALFSVRCLTATTVTVRSPYFDDITVSNFDRGFWKSFALSRINNVLYVLIDGVISAVYSGPGADFALTGGMWTLGSNAIVGSPDYQQSCVFYAHKFRITKYGRYDSNGFTPTTATFDGSVVDTTKKKFRITGTNASSGNLSTEMLLHVFSDASHTTSLGSRSYPLICGENNDLQNLYYGEGTPKVWLTSDNEQRLTSGQTGPSNWSAPVGGIIDAISGQKFLSAGGDGILFTKDVYLKEVHSGKTATIIAPKSITGEYGATRMIAKDETLTVTTATGTAVEQRQPQIRPIALNGEMTLVLVGYYSGYDDRYYPEIYAPQPNCDFVLTSSINAAAYNAPGTLAVRGDRVGNATVSLSDMASHLISLGEVGGPNSIFSICIRAKLNYVECSLNGGNVVTFSGTFNWDNFGLREIRTLSGAGLGGLLHAVAWDNYVSDLSFERLRNYIADEWVNTIPVSFSKLKSTSGLVGEPYEETVTMYGVDDTTIVLNNGGLLGDWEVVEETDLIADVGDRKVTLRGDMPVFETTANLNILAKKAKQPRKPSRALLRVPGDYFDANGTIKDLSLLKNVADSGPRPPRIVYGDSPMPGSGAILYEHYRTQTTLAFTRAAGFDIESKDFTYSFFFKINDNVNETNQPYELFKLKNTANQQYLKLVANSWDALELKKNTNVSTDAPTSMALTTEYTQKRVPMWTWVRLIGSAGKIILEINREVVAVVDAPAAFTGTGRTLSIGSINVATGFGDTMRHQVLFKDIELYDYVVPAAVTPIPSTPIASPNYTLKDTYAENVIFFAPGNSSTLQDKSALAQPVSGQNVVSDAALASDPGYKYVYFNGNNAWAKVAAFQVYTSASGTRTGVDPNAKYIPSGELSVSFEIYPIWEQGNVVNNGAGGQPGVVMQFGNTINDCVQLLLEYYSTTKQYKLILKWTIAGVSAQTHILIPINAVSQVFLRLEKNAAVFVCNGKPTIDIIASPIGARLPAIGNESLAMGFGANFLSASGQDVTPTDNAVTNGKFYLRNLVITNAARTNSVMKKAYRDASLVAPSEYDFPDRNKLALYLPFDGSKGILTDQSPNEVRVFRMADASAPEPVLSNKFPQKNGRSYAYLKDYAFGIESNKLLSGATQEISIRMSIKLDAPTDVSAPNFRRMVLWELSEVEPGSAARPYGRYAIGAYVDIYAGDSGTPNYAKIVVYSTKWIDGYSDYFTYKSIGDDGFGTVGLAYNNGVNQDSDGPQNWHSFEFILYDNCISVLLNDAMISVSNSGTEYAWSNDLNTTVVLHEALQGAKFNRLSFGTGYLQRLQDSNAIQPLGFNGGVQDIVVSSKVSNALRRKFHTTSSLPAKSRPMGDAYEYSTNYLIDSQKLAVSIGQLVNAYGVAGQPFASKVSIEGALAATIEGGAGSGWNISPPVDGSNLWSVAGVMSDALANFRLRVIADAGRYNYDQNFETVFRQLPMSEDKAPAAIGTRLFDESRHNFELAPVAHLLDETVRFFNQPTLKVLAANKDPLLLWGSENESSWTAPGQFFYNPMNNRADFEIEFDVSIGNVTGDQIYFAAYRPDNVRAGNAFIDGIQIYTCSAADAHRVAVRIAAVSTTQSALIGTDIRSAGKKHIHLRRVRGLYELLIDGVVVDRRFCNVPLLTSDGEIRLFGIPGIDAAMFEGNTGNFRWAIGSIRPAPMLPTAVFYNKGIWHDPYYEHVSLSLPLASSYVAGSGLYQYTDESKHANVVSVTPQVLDQTVRLFEAPMTKLDSSLAKPIEVQTVSGVLKSDKRAWTLEFTVVPGEVQQTSNALLFACVSSPLAPVEALDNWWVGIDQDGLGITFGFGNYGNGTFLSAAFPSDERVHVRIGREGSYICIYMNAIKVASQKTLLSICGRNVSYLLIGGSRADSTTYADAHMAMVRYTSSVTRKNEVPTDHFAGARPSGNAYALVDGYEIIPSRSSHLTYSSNAMVEPVDYTGRRRLLTPTRGHKEDGVSKFIGNYGLSVVPEAFSTSGFHLQDNETRVVFKNSNFVLDFVVMIPPSTNGSDLALFSHAGTSVGMGDSPNSFSFVANNTASGNELALLDYQGGLVLGVVNNIRDNQPHRVTIQRDGLMMSIWLDNALLTESIVDVELGATEVLETFGAFGCKLSDPYSLGEIGGSAFIATWYYMRAWAYVAPYDSSANLTPISSIQDLINGEEDPIPQDSLNSTYQTSIFILAFDNYVRPYLWNYARDAVASANLPNATSRQVLPSMVNTSADRTGDPMVNTDLTPVSGLSWLEVDGVSQYADFQSSDQTNIPQGQDFTVQWKTNEYASQGVLWESSSGFYVEDGYLKHRSNAFSPFQLHYNQSKYRKLTHWSIDYNAASHLLAVYCDGAVLGVTSFNASGDWTTLRFGKPLNGNPGTCAYAALDSFQVTKTRMYTTTYTPPLFIGKFSEFIAGYVPPAI